MSIVPTRQHHKSRHAVSATRSFPESNSRWNLVAHGHGLQHSVIQTVVPAPRSKPAHCRSFWESSGMVMSRHNGTAQSARMRTLRHLHELIAALDRGVPHVESWERSRSLAKDAH